MRALDKVIWIITERKAEYDKYGCFYCHYSNRVDCVGDCVLADALHYLKEYHDIKTTMDWHEEMEVIRDGIVNSPLTWDELRKMEGKPVWIDSVPLVRRWVIIKKFHPIGGNKNLFDMEVEDGAHFLRKNMGRDDNQAWWLAYRKERE